MAMSLDDLYPKLLEGLKVVERLSVPRFPPDAPAGDDTAASIREYYEPRLLASMAVPSHRGSQELFWIDKLFPHSRYDLMIVAGDEDVRSSFEDLTPEARMAVLRFGRAFVEFVSSPEGMDRFGLDGGAAHLCWNYDRATVDRENGMFFEKRYHLHMNYWPRHDIDGLPVGCWGDLPDRLLRRRLVDPLILLGERIAFDRFREFSWAGAMLEPDIERDVRRALPPGLKIELGSWHELATPAVSDLIVDIHRASEEAYAQLCNAFTGTAGPSEPWTRPRLRPRRQISAALGRIEWLSEGTRLQLEALADRLRDVSPGYMGVLRAHPALQIEHLALAGLDYSIGFHSAGANTARLPLNRQSPVQLTVQYKLFADIGGAGIPPLPGASLARVSRAGDLFTEAEAARRKEFQQALLDHGLAAIDEGGNGR